MGLGDGPRTSSFQDRNDMKLAIISDLHLEFRSAMEFCKMYDNITSYDYDVIVIAGDILPNKLMRDWVLDEFRKKSPVVWCMGNHDFYGNTVKDDFSVTTIGGKKFASACLWTNFNKNPVSEFYAGRGVTDYRKIKDWNTHKTTEMFNAQKNKLEAEQADVVVTHFPPSPQAIHNKFVGDSLSDYFANNLDISSFGAKLWISGHTHSSFDFVQDGVRVIGNPLGYKSELYPTDEMYMPVIVEI